MRYVHVASAHHRELPECVQLAAQGIGDPDRRVLAMLGARGSYVAAVTAQRTKSGNQKCERGDSNPHGLSSTRT